MIHFKYHGKLDYGIDSARINPSIGKNPKKTSFRETRFGLCYSLSNIATQLRGLGNAEEASNLQNGKKRLLTFSTWII